MSTTLNYFATYVLLSVSAVLLVLHTWLSFILLFDLICPPCFLQYSVLRAIFHASLSSMLYYVPICPSSCIPFYSVFHVVFHVNLHPLTLISFSLSLLFQSICLCIISLSLPSKQSPTNTERRYILFDFHPKPWTFVQDSFIKSNSYNVRQTFVNVTKFN